VNILSKKNPGKKPVNKIVDKYLSQFTKGIVIQLSDEPLYVGMKIKAITQKATRKIQIISDTLPILNEMIRTS
jgi:hypothetical protein